MASDEKILDYIRKKIDNVQNIIDMIFSRIEYGDPILLQPGEDLGINSQLSRNYRKKIIKLRREFLGLPYKEYQRK